MSKSHQTCSCCGWSKVTTYQGLRIHQGKMGCTPKGQSIPQSAQYQYSPSPSYSSSSYSSYSPSSYSYSQPAVSYSPPPIKKETYVTATPKYSPPPSTNTYYEPVKETQEKLQSCHCGWSKVTSYHGLRIHQGKMGCTPKGLGIPEKQQDLFRPPAPRSEVTPTKALEKLRSVKDETLKYDPQPSNKKQRDIRVNEQKKTEVYRPVQKEKPPIKPKPVLKSESPSTPFTKDASLKRENKSDFTTPQQDRPPTGDGAKTRRALDFSTKQKQTEEKLQTCHCGWSKVTSYQGLRIHQGKMGCTPKGLRIPENLQDVFRPPSPKNPSPKNEAMKKHIKALIEERVQKVSEIRSCLKAGEASLDEEWQEIDSVFAAVIKFVEKTRKKELKSVESREESLKSEALSLILMIQEDINKLQDVLDDVDTGADSNLAAFFELKYKDYSLSKDSDLGTMQMDISTMMRQIQKEMDQLSARDLKRAASFAVDVDFTRTEENKDGGQSQQVSVGRKRFSSGRAFWKVRVGARSSWKLGVMVAKTCHLLTLSPDHGYRAVVFHGTEMTAPPVCLELRDMPQKVGVFLDHEQGLLSFYNVSQSCHIHSFTKCEFNGAAFPVFAV